MQLYHCLIVPSGTSQREHEGECLRETRGAWGVLEQTCLTSLERPGRWYRAMLIQNTACVAWAALFQHWGSSFWACSPVGRSCSSHWALWHSAACLQLYLFLSHSGDFKSGCSSVEISYIITQGIVKSTFAYTVLIFFLNVSWYRLLKSIFEMEKLCNLYFIHVIFISTYELCWILGYTDVFIYAYNVPFLVHLLCYPPLPFPYPCPYLIKECFLKKRFTSSHEWL